MDQPELQIFAIQALEGLEIPYAVIDSSRFAVQLDVADIWQSVLSKILHD